MYRTSIYNPREQNIMHSKRGIDLLIIEDQNEAYRSAAKKRFLEGEQYLYIQENKQAKLTCYLDATDLLMQVKPLLSDDLRSLVKYRDQISFYSPETEQEEYYRIALMY